MFPAGQTDSYTGTLETDADTTWQNVTASGGVRTGNRGVIIKNGPGEQDFTQNDGKFGGEFIMNAGSVGIGLGGVFGTGAGGSQLTINGGTLINKTEARSTFETRSSRLAAALPGNQKGENSDTQFLGLAGRSTVELASDPTITVTSSVAGGTGTFILLGEVDDGQLLGEYAPRFHGDRVQLLNA